MLRSILAFIFSIAGIIGFYNDISELVVVGATFVIINVLFDLCSGELRGIASEIVTVIIGVIISGFTNSNLLLTIAVSFCFEEIILRITPIIFSICFLRK